MEESYAAKCNEYIERFIQEKGMTKEEAKKIKIVQEVIKEYGKRGINVKS